MPLRKLIQSTAVRLALAYALAFSVSVGVLFSLMIWMVSSEIADQLRTQIDQDLALFEITANEGKDSLIASVRRHAALAKTEGDAFYSLRKSNGMVIAGDATPWVPIVGLHKLTIPDLIEDADQEEEETFLIRSFKTGNDFMLVGRSLESVMGTRALLLRSGLSLSGLGILVALLGGLWVGRQSSRRIEIITTTAQDIMAGKLSSRIPDDKGQNELSRLAKTINAMLDKIESLLAGMQQVTDDIAHDLRTPLARLKQDLDKTSRNTQANVADLRSVLEHAGAEVDTILATFSALLRIAQIEAGARKKRFANVDLSALLARTADAYAPVAEAEQRPFGVRTDPEINILGDKDLLTQMLANIIENALHHTPYTTPIEMRLEQQKDEIILSIADVGPGIPKAHYTDVFKRFYRLEKSRTTSGSGLGLALVQAIARLHGAQIALRDNAPGLVVELRFIPQEN
jgi:signal transduction histidine kinase